MSLPKSPCLQYIHIVYYAKHMNWGVGEWYTIQFIVSFYIHIVVSFHIFWQCFHLFHFSYFSDNDGQLKESTVVFSLRVWYSTQLEGITQLSLSESIHLFVSNTQRNKLPVRAYFSKGEVLLVRKERQFKNFWKHSKNVELEFIFCQSHWIGSLYSQKAAPGTS